MIIFSKRYTNKFWLLIAVMTALTVAACQTDTQNPQAMQSILPATEAPAARINYDQASQVSSSITKPSKVDLAQPSPIEIDDTFILYTAGNKPIADGEASIWGGARLPRDRILYSSCFSGYLCPASA